jgi:hypothetical protein
MQKPVNAIFPAAAIAAAQQAPQEPTFHAGTELVQVSVVALDKQGKPVADLRREESPRHLDTLGKNRLIGASATAACRAHS